MNEHEAQALRAGAAELGCDLGADEVERLLVFLDLLYRWNRSAGLTAIARKDAVRLHLLDSLALVDFVRERRRIVDLGSGGGLPGIVLAVVLPRAHVTLVESRRRKASYLREVVRTLDLNARCDVREEDARGLASTGLRFDAVVARAFAPPPRLLALGSELVSPDGVVVVMGGGATQRTYGSLTEHAGLRKVCERALVLPGGRERRWLASFAPDGR